MSVGTLVTFRQAEPKTEYLPLALESDFQRFWLPLAKAHRLEWIPHFAAGMPLTAEDIPAILEELGRMREAILTAGHSREIKTEMLERLGRLKSLLEDLDLEDVEEIFIG